MTWFNILKMPNPYGGKWKDLTRDEYYNMDDVNKKRYHYGMWKIANKEVKIAVLPRRAGQAPPKTDDQIRELREVERFHSRQSQRVSLKSKKSNFYSIEDENNRMKQVPTFDAVDLREQTTEEMYDNYSREDKLKYWMRLVSRQSRLSGSYKHSAKKEMERMKMNPNYTPPFDPEKSISQTEWRDSIYRDISEYDDFTPEEKKKYHRRHKSRARRAGNLELHNFHMKMAQRILNNSRLPTRALPEEEQ